MKLAPDFSNPLLAEQDIPLRRAESIQPMPAQSRPWRQRIKTAADLPTQTRDYVPHNDEPQNLTFFELNRMRFQAEQDDEVD